MTRGGLLQRLLRHALCDAEEGGHFHGAARGHDLVTGQRPTLPRRGSGKAATLTSTTQPARIALNADHRVYVRPSVAHMLGEGEESATA